jgi:hypothetical protein
LLSTTVVVSSNYTLRQHTFGMGGDSSSFPSPEAKAFLIVKKRRVAGVDTLVLRGAEGDSFNVAREWTDRATPNPYESLGVSPSRFEVDLLLELANLLEQLAPSDLVRSSEAAP